MLFTEKRIIEMVLEIGLRLVKTICDEESVIISLDSDDRRTTFVYRFKMMGD